MGWFDSDTRRKLDELSEQYRDLELEKAELESFNEEYKNQIEELNDKYHGLEQEKADLEQDKAELEISNEELKAQLEALKQQNEGLLAWIEQKKKEEEERELPELWEVKQQIGEIDLPDQLRGLFDGLISELNQKQESFYNDLQRWKLAVQREEFEPLLGFCARFYLAVEKYREVWKTGAEEDPEVEKYYKRLVKLRDLLVKSLEPLGITSFEPQTNEEFDPFLHQTADGDEDVEGIVVRTIGPGLVFNGKTESPVLKAYVEVKEK